MIGKEAKIEIITPDLVSYPTDPQDTIYLPLPTGAPWADVSDWLLPQVLRAVNRAQVKIDRGYKVEYIVTFTNNYKSRSARYALNLRASMYVLHDPSADATAIARHLLVVLGMMNDGSNFTRTTALAGLEARGLIPTEPATEPAAGGVA